MAPFQGIAPAVDELLKKVNRRGTFEDGCKKLIWLVDNHYAAATDKEQQTILAAVGRVATVLQTRYTALGFWLLGLRLFKAAETAVTAPADRKKVQSYVAKAEEFTGGGADGPPAEAEEAAYPPPVRGGMERAAGPFLFEGQLSSSGGASDARPPWLVQQAALFSMLGEHQEDLLQRRQVAEARSEGSGDPPASSSSQGSPERTTREGAEPSSQEDADAGRRREQEEGEDEAAGGAAPVTDRERAQRRLSELLALPAGAEHDDDDDGGLDFLSIMRAAIADAGPEEIVGLEDAIRATLQDVPRGAPPASKKVVAKLPQVKVTHEDLQRLGAETVCCVCREALSVGDVMQEMPCHHSFHPACLKPWLDEHNSCPVCRFELPTDDADYERNKERAKEDEEERRGIENALPEGEFMYL